MANSRLILFAHGSTDPIWQETFHRIVRELRGELGEGKVGLAFMERAKPTLVDSVAQAAADRVNHVQVLPMFFSAGGHVSRDIPRLIDEAKVLFPVIKIELLRPIGEHPSFTDLVGRIARSALDGAVEADPLSKPAIYRESQR